MQALAQVVVGIYHMRTFILWIAQSRCGIIHCLMKKTFGTFRTEHIIGYTSCLDRISEPCWKEAAITLRYGHPLQPMFPSLEILMTGILNRIHYLFVSINRVYGKAIFPRFQKASHINIIYMVSTERN